MSRGCAISSVFLRACAARTGQLLNMSELGRDVGVSATTAPRVDQRARDLPPDSRCWSRIIASLGKRLVKSPKLYFADTGLAAYSWPDSSPPAHSFIRRPSVHSGKTTWWASGIRYRDWHAPSLQIWFWQDRTGREVDLLLEADQRLVPVECKWKERPDAGDAAGIRRVRALYGSAVAAGFVACTTGSAFQVAPEVTAVPGWRLHPAPSGDVAEMMPAAAEPRAGDLVEPDDPPPEDIEPLR